MNEKDLSLYDSARLDVEEKARLMRNASEAARLKAHHEKLEIERLRLDRRCQEAEDRVRVLENELREFVRAASRQSQATQILAHSQQEEIRRLRELNAALLLSLRSNEVTPKITAQGHEEHQKVITPDVSVALGQLGDLQLERERLSTARDHFVDSVALGGSEASETAGLPAEVGLKEGI